MDIHEENERGKGRMNCGPNAELLSVDQKPGVRCSIARDLVPERHREGHGRKLLTLGNSAFDFRILY